MKRTMSYAEVQLRQACAELDRRLRSGAHCRAEELLARFPQIGSSAELAVELIYTEIVTRQELGQPPRPEEYAARFPQWREEITEQLRVHELLNGHPPTDRAGPAPLQGQPLHIGPYEVLQELARGNMGVVYRARHRSLNRLVALKTVRMGAHASAAELRRFRTEAEAVARLQHPNIVQIFEVGEAEHGPFLALELVEGSSLAERLDSGPLPPRAAAELVETLARAIHHAHSQGILHRDLKPHNVLLAEDGTPKVTDFGLAKLLDHPGGHTETGAIFGTPSYMAPEQAEGGKGDVGVATDVYALGAILYECLTGTPPFRGENVLETLQQVVSQEPVPADRLQPGVPRDLATVCMECLHKEPARRYRSPAALADDLRRFRRGEPIYARRAGLGERGWKWARRRPAVALLLAGLCAAVLALLLGSLWYNARLHAAVQEADRQRGEAQAAAEQARSKEDEALVAAREALRQKVEAQRQSTLAQDRFAALRRLAYTLQLRQVEEHWRRGSPDALRMLEDEERCPVDLRDFAWGLYHHLCRQDRVLETRHARGVPAVAFSPDGNWLALAGGDDCSVAVWDPAGTSPTFTLTGHQGPVVCIAFSPDSSLIATGGGDRIVRLWKISTSRQVAALKGHASGVHALAFSPDGQMLASAGADRAVKLWDLGTNKERATLNGHTGLVTCLAFTADGNRLATGSEDRTVRLWDPLTGDNDRERGRLKLEDQGQVRCLAFSPDGKYLAVGCRRRPSIGLFAVGDLRPVATFWGHLDQIHTLAFSPDGALLASGSDDRTVRLWEVRTGAQRFTLQGHDGGIRSLTFSPDGRLVASAGADSRVRLWDVASRVLVNQDDQDLDQSSASRIVSLVFSPDGRTAISGGHDGRLRLWDVESRLETAAWRAHRDLIWSLALTADGRTLATGSEDGTVRLWDMASRRCLAILEGYRQRVRCVAFSPDGRTLAATDDEGAVRLVDVATRQQRHCLRGHRAATCSLGFSPDGKTLAAGTSAGRVVLWDLATHKQQTATALHRRPVLFTVFSPDGRTLATGGLDNRILLSDPTRLAPRVELPWHEGYVFSAAFTPDSRTLATGGGSRVGSHIPGAVKLWDVATGQCRAMLPRQSGPVQVSPNGRTLATVSDHTALQLWDSDPPGP
jgi:WD40 repeat protein